MPGGGVAYVRSLGALDNVSLDDDRQVGVNIVQRALEEPLRMIANNAGIEGAMVLQNVKAKTGAVGYDAASEEYVDMVSAGIIDPTKVTRIALQNSASVAALLLTTEALVTDVPEEEPPRRARRPRPHGLLELLDHQAPEVGKTAGPPSSPRSPRQGCPI